MKKSILLPSLSLVMGIVVFILRKYQLANVKNVETQLYTPHATETYLLMGAILLFAVCLGLFLLSGGRELPNYTFTVYCPSPLFMATVVTGSFLYLLSTVVSIMDVQSQYASYLENRSPMNPESFDFPFLTIVNMLLVVLVGMVMIYLGKQAYRGEYLKECWLTTLPAYMGLARLTVTYRNYGSLSSFQDNFYPIFGVMFLALALYHLCATAYVGPRPRKIVFFALVSVLFTGAMLASGICLADKLLSLGSNLYLLAFSAAILENTYSSRENYRTPPPEEEDPQENSEVPV
ncbi:MAG: hypothetical protein R3Y63_01980 [Eubacteriales bacterium]